jgi:hypothetical protein
MKITQGAFLALAMVFAIAMGAPAAPAQTKLSGPVQIEAKRAELAQIQEQLSDPDSLKRQAAIMTIVESHNATKVDFALKIALAADDPSVRAIALRAYMANLKELRFDVQSPPDIQRQLDAALSGDPARIADLVKRYPYLEYVVAAGYEVHFRLKDYAMSSNTGQAWVSASNADLTFAISGDRVSGTGGPFRFAECGFEFQPQMIVKNSPPVLKGTLQCAHNGYFYPRLTITAPMF